MNTETPIYEIHIMERPYEIDIHGFPDCGTIEIVGFYYEKDVSRAQEKTLVAQLSGLHQ